MGTLYKTIDLYIEGDGLAWQTRTRISSNPTPINPVALKLMLKDNASCSVYLARPFQYVPSTYEGSRYWTSHRYSKVVVDNSSEVLTQLKNRYNNQEFKLIGHSGGGTIALLLAVARNDIKEVVTYGGNINTEKTTQIHNATPLTDSLNPAEYAQKLQSIKQHHIIGNRDSVIPLEVYQSYIIRFKNKENISYEIVDKNHWF